MSGFSFQANGNKKNLFPLWRIVFGLNMLTLFYCLYHLILRRLQHQYLVLNKGDFNFYSNGAVGGSTVVQWWVSSPHGNTVLGLISWVGAFLWGVWTFSQCLCASASRSSTSGLLTDSLSPVNLFDSVLVSIYQPCGELLTCPGLYLTVTQSQLGQAPVWVRRISGD